MATMFRILRRYRFRQLLLGPDAGPWFQDIDEWKRTVHLAAPAALEVAGLDDVASSLVKIIAEYRSLASDPAVAPYIEDDLRETEQELAARRAVALVLLDASDAHTARKAGVPVYSVGYHRGTSLLTYTGSDNQEITASPFYVTWAAPFVLPAPLQGRVPAGSVPRTSWGDRMLRALSGGVVTEPLVQQARCAAHGGRKGASVASPEQAVAVRRCLSGESVVAFPGLGRVYRVEVPACSVALFAPDGVQRSGTLWLPPAAMWVAAAAG